MSQHPLDSPSPLPSKQDSIDSMNFPPLTDDDLSTFERRVSTPIPHNDSIIRAQSPFGRRYLKPINGIQTKGFARSGTLFYLCTSRGLSLTSTSLFLAQRRSSVLTLGSIERLQNFYARKDLKVNK